MKYLVVGYIKECHISDDANIILNDKHYYGDLKSADTFLQAFNIFIKMLKSKKYLKVHIDYLGKFKG